jgi:hypothetical protein
MMSTISPPLEQSAVLGCQQPRISHVPECVSSAGAEAIELAALAGLNLDPWEQSVLIGALGERDDGKWAAFEVGIVVPRQNGKGAILEARELAGLFLFGENLLIHSAHEQSTSSEHFRRLLSLIEGVPELDRRVLKAPKGKGAEAIELHGGQRILFKTRTGGGGRGLTADFVALDEAMILPAATTAALVPTMAARAIEGNPQLFYAGSAVDQEKHEHGQVLARLRARGMKCAPRVAYFEWSAEGDDPDLVSDEVREDPEAWAQANPGMGIRISAEHIGNECGGALGPREFAVERLGVGDWPLLIEDGAVISVQTWKGLIDVESMPDSSFVFTFDVSPNRGTSTIGVAGRRDDGNVHLEITSDEDGTPDHRPGTGWVVDRIVHLSEKYDPVAILYDEKSPAASLASDIEDAGVKLTAINASEHAQACGRFFDAVTQGTVRHLGTTEIVTAIRGAAKRPLGDAWAWSRKNSSIDISPLVAVTLALWGVETQASYREPLAAWA